LKQWSRLVLILASAVLFFAEIEVSFAIKPSLPAKFQKVTYEAEVKTTAEFSGDVKCTTCANLNRVQTHFNVEPVTATAKGQGYRVRKAQAIEDAEQQATKDSGANATKALYAKLHEAHSASLTAAGEPQHALTESKDKGSAFVQTSGSRTIGEPKLVEKAAEE